MIIYIYWSKYINANTGRNGCRKTYRKTYEYSLCEVMLWLFKSRYGMLQGKTTSQICPISLKECRTVHHGSITTKVCLSDQPHL